MYFEPEGTLRSGCEPAPPFHIDFLASGGAAVTAGRTHVPEALPLRQLYLCDGCSRVACRQDLVEEVDAYYCPHCLENMPATEALHYGMRCSKCWECPLCSTTLTMCTVVADAGPSSSMAALAAPPAVGAVQVFYMMCSFCHWSTQGRLESSKPDQLIADIIAVEREGEGRQRMLQFTNWFKVHAQEFQREKENLERVKRKSMSRQSFASNAIGMTTRRFTQNALGASARQRASDVALLGMQAPLEGKWDVEHAEEKLRRRLMARQDSRFEARALAAADAAPLHVSLAGSETEASGQSPAVTVAESAEATLTTTSNMSALLRQSFALKRKTVVGLALPGGLTSCTESEKRPVLRGLNARELIARHIVSESDMGRKSLVDHMLELLDGQTEQLTLAQRLQQFVVGYEHLESSASTICQSPRALRVARGQMEVPLLHRKWTLLLPVRKLLLTKRSRRCRLPGVSGQDNVGGKKVHGLAGRVASCGKIVVKPQINPCSNPPFQKNGSAVAFVPRFQPFLLKASRDDTTIVAGVSNLDAPRERNLEPGEECEIIFVLCNPMDAEVKVTLDPQFFNPPAAGEPTIGKFLECPNALEQNVVVDTQAFETILDKFQDLGEEVVEETEMNKKLINSDDKDLFPGRKLHKLLCRLRFKKPTKPLPGPAAWVFFTTLVLEFTDAQNVSRKVSTFVRFGAPNRQSRGAEQLSLVRDFLAMRGPLKDCERGDISSRMRRSDLTVTQGFFSAPIISSGKSYEVEIVRPHRSGVGLCLDKNSKALVLINEGCIQSHNIAWPEHAIKIKDILMSVNGKGTLDKIIDELLNAERLQIQVSRADAIHPVGSSASFAP